MHQESSLRWLRPNTSKDEIHQIQIILIITCYSNKLVWRRSFEYKTTKGCKSSLSVSLQSAMSNLCGKICLVSLSTYTYYSYSSSCQCRRVSVSLIMPVVSWFPALSLYSLPVPVPYLTLVSSGCARPIRISNSSRPQLTEHWLSSAKLLSSRAEKASHSATIEVFT